MNTPKPNKPAKAKVSTKPGKSTVARPECLKNKQKAEKEAKQANPLMMNDQSWNRSAIMDIVCERISTSTRSIATILKEPYNGHGLPDYTTFKRWIAVDDDLCTQYARAKEDQADFMAEEMLEIADDGSNDWMERNGKDGENLGYQVNGEHVQRSRLRLDTRKWLASKLKPKKYGDKTTIAGDPGNPLAVLLMDQITTSPNSRIQVSK